MYNRPIIVSDIKMIKWNLEQVRSVNVCYCSNSMEIGTLIQTELYLISGVSFFIIVAYCSM